MMTTRTRKPSSHSKAPVNTWHILIVKPGARPVSTSIEGSYLDACKEVVRMAADNFYRLAPTSPVFMHCSADPETAMGQYTVEEIRNEVK